jgi:iron complex outermembrane receptor protein
MKTRYLSILLTFISCFAAMAQSSIEGQVQKSNGEPLAYANVQLLNTPLGSVTDDSGNFIIQSVPQGSYILRISFIDFSPQTIAVELARDQKLKLNPITLEPAASSLNEVSVVGKSDNYLQKLPSSSLRLQEPLIRTAQNIQVISDELIQDQQSFDMLETVTRNVSGAQMIEHWGTFARINMRGFKIPAFRNGFNVDVPWGPLSEDMAIVDRIEFVKGPAGFMLSSGEPGGLYNVVTKKPDLFQSNEASFTLGSFNTLRGAIDLGGKVANNDKLLYRMNAMASTKGTQQAYDFTKRYTIAPSVSYQINETSKITASYIYQYMQMSLVGSAYVFSPNGFADLPRDFTLAEPNIDPTTVDEHNLFIDFEHSISDKWKLTAKLAYILYGQEGSSLWVDSVAKNGDVVRTMSSFDALNESKLGQLFLSGEESTGAIDHNFLIGLDLGQKDYFADWWQTGIIGPERTFNIYNPTYGLPADQIPGFDRSQSIRKRATSGSYPAIIGQQYASFYAQDQLSTLENKLKLTLAGRFTDYNGWSYGSTTHDQVFSPRVGLNYAVTPYTSVYGVFDQSFNPVSGATIDGEAFVPVRANNIEFGIKRNWFDESWSTTLAAYQITKQNMVVGHPDREVLKENSNAQIQLGEAVSKGIEFDAQGKITDDISIVFNYAFTNVEITEDTNKEIIGTKVAGHAKHITNAWIKYQLPTTSLNGFSISLGSQYQNDRSSWNWGADNQSLLPDYFRLDAALAYESKGLRVGLNVNNLLDEYLYSGSAYADFYYWQAEPGINFRLNITQKF